MLEIIVLIILFYLCYKVSEESSSNSKTINNRYKYTTNTTSKVSSYSKEEYTHFHTKIVGVTIGNRQNIIKNLKVNQSLSLVREPNNQFDKNAIAVYDGCKMIGYIKKNIAEALSKDIDNGYSFHCTITAITGGGSNNYGVNVKIDKYDIEATCKQCGAVFWIPFKSDEFVCSRCNSVLYPKYPKSNNTADSKKSTTEYWMKRLSDDCDYDYYDDDDYDYDYDRFRYYVDYYFDCNHNFQGEAAPWDSCEADQDMCCGYDH